MEAAGSVRSPAEQPIARLVLQKGIGMVCARRLLESGPEKRFATLCADFLPHAPGESARYFERTGPCAVAGLLASGSSYSRTFPRARLLKLRKVAFPVSYPATVAGTASAWYRLPLSGFARRREASRSARGSPQHLSCQKNPRSSGQYYLALPPNGFDRYSSKTDWIDR